MKRTRGITVNDPQKITIQGDYYKIRLLSGAVIREPHREKGDNFFPLCALIRGMHETSHADWWDARVT